MKKTLIALTVGMIMCSVKAQEATSGTQTTTNLINPNNWTGQSVTGSWGGANLKDHVFGCCTGGPGAAVDTTGTGYIWFSWGMSTVSQSIAINNALSGTGLKVSGFNYSYDYYNYGENRGTLATYINVTGNSGQELAGYFWNHAPTEMNGWYTNSGTKTFNNPYSLASLGNITMSFTGKDDKFWAGYYGPSVANANLSLNYGVDACVSDPLSSASCPGFGAAMAKLTPATTSTEPAIVAVIVEPVTTSTPAAAEIVPATTTSAPVVATTTTAVVSVVPSATSTIVATPSATRNTTTANSTAVAAAMRAVAETQATVATVLSQAQESATASQAQESATASQAPDNSAAPGVSGQPNSTVPALGTGLSVTFGFQIPGSFTLPGTQLNLGRSTVDSASTQQTVVSTPNMPSLNTAPPTNTETTAAETSPTSTRALAAMSNTQMNTAEENTAAPNTRSVRNTTPLVELAGGADIGALAMAPPGFAVYLGTQLRDVAFYPPREVYRGQVNVDNRQVLRGLGSDARHREMVDQQYRK